MQAERIEAQEAQDEEDEDDEEWADELLFESPLDNVDAYVLFTQKLYRKNSVLQRRWLKAEPFSFACHRNPKRSSRRV